MNAAAYDASAYDASAYPSTFVTADTVLFTLRANVQVLLIERGRDPYKGHLALPGGFVDPHEDALTAAWRELYEETGIHGWSRDPATVAAKILDTDHAAVLAVPVERRAAALDNLARAGLTAVPGYALPHNALIDTIPASRADRHVIVVDPAQADDVDVVGYYVTDMADHVDLDQIEQLKAYSAPGRDPRHRIVSIAHVGWARNLPDPVARDDAAAARWVPVSEALDGALAFDHAQILTDALERIDGRVW